MNKYGKAVNSPSPVGEGLYLNGSSDTYAELKGYNTSCMEHPSTCDISVGFFFKMRHQSGTQVFFGNKVDTNTTILYEGVNILYVGGRIHVLVYSQNKFCKRVFHPRLDVWFYFGLVWEKVGKLALKIDSWFSPSRSQYCGDSPSGLFTSGKYFLGKGTFPIAYYGDLNIWHSKQSSSVLEEKWRAAFGEYSQIFIRWPSVKRTPSVKR